MKKILLASVTTAAFAIGSVSGPAMAADMKTKAPSPVYTKAPPPVLFYDWSGLYLGAHGSYSWSTTKSTTTDTATRLAFPSVSTNSSGWHGGGQIGYDYMMPTHVVIGAVADISSGRSITTTTVTPVETTMIQGKTNESGTVRGRLGYALDSNVLLYGTGGWAWANAQTTRTQVLGQVGNAVAGTVETVKMDRSGWTAGAGAAYAFAHNWNVFAEYRYTKIPSTTVTFPIAQRSTNSSSNTNVIEVGLNYKFDWAGPMGGHY